MKEASANNQHFLLDSNLIYFVIVLSFQTNSEVTDNLIKRKCPTNNCFIEN